MDLFDKLTNKLQSGAYSDAGTSVVLRITQSLNLKDWQDGIPVGYTREEMDAIDKRMANFQRIADEEGGGPVSFHPDAVDSIRRTVAAQALENWANRDGWKFSDKLPDDWRSRASTYLKAWTSNLNPTTLLDLAELLARAGSKEESKEALKVVLLFPAYAHIHYSGSERPEMVDLIIKSATDALGCLTESR